MSSAGNYHPMMNSEEHRAWWDTLTDDEKTVGGCPPGARHTLLLAAYAKRALLMPGGTVEQRLNVLERLNRLFEDVWPTHETLAAIQPMSDTEIEMMREAWSLNAPQDPGHRASYDMLTRIDVYMHFVRLNPSLFDVIAKRHVQIAPTAGNSTHANAGH